MIDNQNDGTICRDLTAPLPGKHIKKKKKKHKGKKRAELEVDAIYLRESPWSTARGQALLLSKQVGSGSRALNVGLRLL